MYKIASFVLLIFMGSYAFSRPIENVAKLDSDIEACIKGNAPNNCLNDLLPKYYLPGNEGIGEQLEQVTALLTQWLGESSVYDIQLIQQKKVGTIADNRHYAIESTGGGFMVLNIRYVWLLGNPYLMTFNLSSTPETINALLAGEL